MAKPKLKPGAKIKIKKQVSLNADNKYVLSPGETFSVESVGVTGAVRITKTFQGGVTRHFLVSKAFYERV
jgi:hypothetical protein